MSQYRVGLVGLGQIAQGYGSPGEAAPYCHAGGIAQSDKVQLVAAAEPFEKAKYAFLKKWGSTFETANGAVAFYPELATMLAEAKLDIIGVCVKGPMHYDVVREILESASPPRAIFLEKPPFCSLEEADEIVALAAQKDIGITVSYSRHWAPQILKMQELVRAGLIGRVHSVVGYCGGTILSFASHTTDLICQFASAQAPGYAPLTVLADGAESSQGAPVPSDFAERGFEIEPAIRKLVIEFENGVTGLQVGQASDYDQFYVDVFGDGGRARVGMYTPPAAFDADNQPIDLKLDEFPADTSVFHIAYDQIADYLDGGALPHCSGENWQQVNEIGFAAIESAWKKERVTLPNTARTRRIFANG